MPDAVVSTDPAFRAWLDGLKAPNFLDKDALLAAGVIDDDDDWLMRRDRGWLAFIVKATDAQQMALFGLVQAALKGRKLVVLPADLADALEAYRRASLTYLGDCWLPEGKDESAFDSHWHRQREAERAVRSRLGSLTNVEVAAMAREAERRRAVAAGAAA